MSESISLTSGGGVAEPGRQCAASDGLSQPVVAAAAGFHVWESTLPQVMGFGLKELRSARAKLAHGTDWIFDPDDNRRVKYSACGLERLKTALGMPVKTAAPAALDAPGMAGTSEPAPAPQISENAAPEVTQAQQEWVVAKIARLFANTRLVEVEIPEKKQRITARVNPGWGRLSVGWPMEVKRDGINAIWIGRPNRRWPRR